MTLLRGRWVDGTCEGEPKKKWGTFLISAHHRHWRHANHARLSHLSVETNTCHAMHLVPICTGSHGIPGRWPLIPLRSSRPPHHGARNELHFIQIGIILPIGQ